MTTRLNPLANAKFLDVVIVDVFTVAECDRIIAMLDSAEWKSARVTDGDDGYGIVNPDNRSVLTQPLPVSANGWPIQPMIDAIETANADIWRYDLWGFAQSDHPSVLRYEGQANDHFRAHHDAGAFAPTRKLSYSLQLDKPTSYIGGDLIMGGHAQTGGRQQGTMTLFSSVSVHEVTPLYSGIRHAIVGWVHGPTFR